MICSLIVRCCSTVHDKSKILVVKSLKAPEKNSISRLHIKVGKPKSVIEGAHSREWTTKVIIIVLITLIVHSCE